MNLKRAVKLAVGAMLEKVQTLAFDANMRDRLQADYPLAIRSSKERADYLEAIKTLEQAVKEGVENDRKKNDL